MRNLRYWYFNLNKNYSLELDLFKWESPVYESLNFLGFECNWCHSKRFDHCPKFSIILIIMNLKIFEFSIQNKWESENYN